MVMRVSHRDTVCFNTQFSTIDGTRATWLSFLLAGSERIFIRIFQYTTTDTILTAETASTTQKIPVLRHVHGVLGPFNVVSSCVYRLLASEEAFLADYDCVRYEVSAETCRSSCIYVSRLL